MINQTTFSTLNQAIANSQELLTTYAFSDGLSGNFTTAFGSEYDRAAALAWIIHEPKKQQKYASRLFFCLNEGVKILSQSPKISN